MSAGTGTVDVPFRPATTTGGQVPPLRTAPLMPIEHHYIREAFLLGESPAEIAQRMQQPEPVVLAVLRVAVARGLHSPHRPDLFEPIGIDEGDDPPAPASPRTATPHTAPEARP